MLILGQTVDKKLLLCCSIIAALGLAESSSVVLVASMLVSPLMVCRTVASCQHSS